MDYTPTQKLLMDKLGDGKLHSRDELAGVLDCYTSDGAFRVHITYLRQKLRTQGKDILCVRSPGFTSYRLVRVDIDPT